MYKRLELYKYLARFSYLLLWLTKYDTVHQIRYTVYFVSVFKFISPVELYRFRSSAFYLVFFIGRKEELVKYLQSHMLFLSSYFFLWVS